MLHGSGVALDDFFFKTSEAVQAALLHALQPVPGGVRAHVGAARGGWRNVAVELPSVQHAGLALEILEALGVQRGWRRGPAETLPGQLRGHVLCGPPVAALDFDGVVARVIERPRRWGESEESWLARQATALERIDPAAVRRLNRVVDAVPHLRFVASTTWRQPDPKTGTVLHPPSRLEGYLRHHGFRGRIIDATPHMPGRERWEEIQAWVDAQPVPPAALAIFDDWEMGPLSGRHVRTDYDRRLTEADVERGIALLQGGAQKCAGRDIDAIPTQLSLFSMVTGAPPPAP